MRVPRNPLLYKKKEWHPVRKRKKYIPYAIVFVISVILLGFFVYIIDPGQVLIFGSLHVTPIVLFFFLFSIALFCFTTSILLNIRRGILVTIFCDGVLVLRYFGIKSLFNIIILFLLIALIETFFIYQPHKPKLPKERKLE